MAKRRFEKLRALLDEWGFRKSMDLDGLGYPDETPEAEMMAYRCKVSGTPSGGTFPEWQLDTRMEKVEWCISSLPFEQEIVIRAQFERAIPEGRLKELVSGFEKIRHQALSTLEAELWGEIHAGRFARAESFDCSDV